MHCMSVTACTLTWPWTLLRTHPTWCEWATKSLWWDLWVLYIPYKACTTPVLPYRTVPILHLETERHHMLKFCHIMVPNASSPERDQSFWFVMRLLYKLGAGLLLHWPHGTFPMLPLEWLVSCAHSIPLPPLQYWNRWGPPSRPSASSSLHIKLIEL